VKIAVLFGPLCLSFRKSFDFDNLWTDPRGLTGSEIGFVRIAEELQALGHEVELYTEATQRKWQGMFVSSLSDRRSDDHDVAIAINEPDLLRGFPHAFGVWDCWLNDVTFCQPGFDEHVDLAISPSLAHLEQVKTNPLWRHVHVTPTTPRGMHVYDPHEMDWEMIPLGCDPEKYAGFEKIPGRVVYCSSPDRGLHWLLQEWAKIKRAVPHATLHIFYRLKDWMHSFDSTPYFPPIESLRARALYVAEALRRMPDMGITVRDSVSRETIEREMAQAEVLAYPCDTTSWSEGFSCTILEACAARACPVITDCDALPSVYGGSVVMAERGKWGEWSDSVITALKDADFRNDWNDKAEALAKELTWKNRVKKLEAAIRARR